jgi:deazaflavin-dependent oxidoreductase (nitroreductase family)
MPIPDRIRHLNKVRLNRLTRPLFRLLPGMAVVVHRGRRSGRAYQTPVNVFPRPGGRYVIALTYGPDTDWVRNVLAAGGCELLTRGTHLELTAPQVYRDESRREIRVPERLALRVLRVFDFLELRVVPDA